MRHIKSQTGVAIVVGWLALLGSGATFALAQEDADLLKGALLTGTPRVPMLDKNAADNNLKIFVRTSGAETIDIYRDRAEWEFHNGSWPSLVKLNDREWKPEQAKTLPNRMPTQFMSETFPMFGCTIHRIRNRDYFRIAALRDHYHLEIDALPSEYGSVAVIRPPVPFPDFTLEAATRSRLEAALRGAKPRPHPTDRKIPTRKEREGFESEWRNSRMAGAYERYGRHSPAWDQDAIAYLKLMSQPQPDMEQAIVSARKLFRAGCDDPLVCMAHATLLMGIPQRDRADPFALHAVLAFEKSQYPKRVTRHAPILLASMYFGQSSEKIALIDPLLARAVAETADVLSENLTEPELRAFYAELKVEEAATHWAAAPPGEIAQAMANHPAANPWLSHMLIGDYQVRAGYAARGEGSANTVTPEGQKALTAALAQAKAHYVEAWRLQPKFSEAATQMITATTAQYTDNPNEARFWFDEAVAVELDSEAARSLMLYNLMPRWYGSHEKMIQFGLECLRTKRFDTQAPRFLINALLAVKNDGGDVKTLLKKLNVEKEVLAGLEQFEKNAPDDAAKKIVKTENVVLAHAFGYENEARKWARDLADDFDEATLKRYETWKFKLLDDIAVPGQSARDAKPLHALPKTTSGKPVQNFAISPDGREIAAVGTDGKLAMWDTKTGQSKEVTVGSDPERKVSGVLYSPKGKYLAIQQSVAASDRAAKTFHWPLVLRDAASGKDRDLIPPGKHKVFGRGWYPDERYLVIGDYPGTVHIYDVESSRMVSETPAIGAPLASPILNLAVSPDGKFVATGHDAGSIYLRKLPAKEALAGTENVPCEQIARFDRQGGPIMLMRFSPNGKVLAASDQSGAVTLWNIERRARVERLEGYFIDFSPDSSRIATLGGEKLKLDAAIWNATSGKPLARLTDGHSNYVSGLAFLRDGKSVITSDVRGNFRSWDVSKVK